MICAWVIQMYDGITRFLDLILAFITAFITLPLMIFIAFTIFIFDGRPIFFLQDRVGLNKRIFKIYKFRTMIVKFDNENNFDQVTTTGRWLRRFSFDELPQLFNILQGNMSLIGPRPMPADINLTCSPRMWDVRHSVKPGLTGLSQIYTQGKPRLFSEKLKYDIYFVKNKTIRMYFYIIFKTFFAVMKRLQNNKNGETL